MFGTGQCCQKALVCHGSSERPRVAASIRTATNKIVRHSLTSTQELTKQHRGRH